MLEKLPTHKELACACTCLPNTQPPVHLIVHCMHLLPVQTHMHGQTRPHSMHACRQAGTYACTMHTGMQSTP